MVLKSLETVVPEIRQGDDIIWFQMKCRCIYLKFSGNKFIILVLYVDDILFVSNDTNLLYVIKRMLFETF